VNAEVVRLGSDRLHHEAKHHAGPPIKGSCPLEDPPEGLEHVVGEEVVTPLVDDREVFLERRRPVHGEDAGRVPTPKGR
jgi:hypothetical protein